MGKKQEPKHRKPTETNGTEKNLRVLKRWGKTRQDCNNKKKTHDSETNLHCKKVTVGSYNIATAKSYILRYKVTIMKNKLKI